MLVGLNLFAKVIAGIVVIPDDEQTDGAPADEVDPEVVPGVAVGAGVAEQVGTVIVSVVVETVPPKAKALPTHPIVLPMLIPESSISVPLNVELAPRVVAWDGVQNTSHAEAPLDKVTTELETVVRAPVILKRYVPLPESVIPPEPIEVAAVIQ